jgi:hypothetical protein
VCHSAQSDNGHAPCALANATLSQDGTEGKAWRIEGWVLMHGGLTGRSQFGPAKDAGGGASSTAAGVTTALGDYIPEHPLAAKHASPSPPPATTPETGVQIFFSALLGPSPASCELPAFSSTGVMWEDFELVADIRTVAPHNGSQSAGVGVTYPKVPVGKLGFCSALVRECEQAEQSCSLGHTILDQL